MVGSLGLSCYGYGMELTGIYQKVLYDCNPLSKEWDALTPHLDRRRNCSDRCSVLLAHVCRGSCSSGH